MKAQEGLNLPPSFTDLAFLLMFVFILITLALATEARQEYQTKVDLLQHRQMEGDGKGTDILSISVTVSGGNCTFVIESKRMGVKKYSDLKLALAELKRLSPPELIIRADKEAPWKYPLEIMVESNALGIIVGVASEEES